MSPLPDPVRLRTGAAAAVGRLAHCGRALLGRIVPNRAGARVRSGGDEAVGDGGVRPEAKAPEPTAALVLSPAPPRASLASLWFGRLRRALPWASLVVGMVSALIMDRSARRAVWIALAAAAVWLALILTHWALRAAARQVSSQVGADVRTNWDGTPRRSPAGLQRGLITVARYSTLALTQSLTQLCLFFALPFYFHAAALGATDFEQGHAVFLLSVGGVSAFSLWDPWTEALLRHPVLAPLLPAAASFLALNVVLPSLGVPTASSLWLASVGAGLGVLSLSWASQPWLKRPAAGGRSWAARARALGSLAYALSTLLLAAAWPLLLWAGVARAIPPAPLRLVRAEMGLEVVDKWVAAPVTELSHLPERLICATAIASPVGVRDSIVHVWRKDGAELSRVHVRIVGGRQEGYRTRSWLSRFPVDPHGVYSCHVETGAGQVLGSCRATIRAQHSAERPPEAR